jgi:hypothetical protein
LAFIEEFGPLFRHIKGKHNKIADALSRLELDDSSEESKLEKPTTAQCKAAIISRSDIIDDKLSATDGFEMIESFGINLRRKTKMRTSNFLCNFPKLQKCKIKINR